MGATILGDGCVAPILDVVAIADLDLFSVKTLVRTSIGKISEKKLPAVASPSA